MTSPSTSSSGFTFPDWTGKDLGEFIIEKLISKGGMAVVYEGIQKNLQRKVAIKVLPPAMSEHEEFQKLFRQEAVVLANLSHPNIVPIYSFGNLENCPYFVMKRIEGETLAEKIRTQRHSFFKVKTLFAVQDVLLWAKHIAAALEYAHSKGVFHCDIKPSNILVDNHERLFVTDFGLTKIFQSAMAQELLYNNFGYVSYEQIRGRKVDGRTDVFSLGCVMYELLTGKPASEAKTVEDAQAAFERGTPVSPSTLKPSIPLLLDQIIMKAMEKDPNDRYQTMGEFQEILYQFSTGKLQARLDPRLQPGARGMKGHGGPRQLSKTTNVAILLTILVALLGGLAVTVGLPWLKKRQNASAQQVNAWCSNQWQLAQNYQKNQLNEMARQHYRKIVDQHPKHPLADKAREELKKLDAIS